MLRPLQYIKDRKPMSSRRASRVNDNLRQQLSDLIRKDLNDPRIAEIVSITQVETSPDFRVARVYVSTFSTEEEKRKTVEGLQAAANYLRRELMPRLNMRNVPTLTFVRDDSLDEGARLTALILEATADAPKPPRKGRR